MSHEGDCYCTPCSEMGPERISELYRAERERDELRAKMGTLVYELELERDALRAERDQLLLQRRWNIEETPAGLRVCRNEHHRSEDCNWEDLVPVSQVDALRAEVERLKIRDASADTRIQDLVQQVNFQTSRKCYGCERFLQRAEAAEARVRELEVDQEVAKFLVGDLQYRLDKAEGRVVEP